MMTKSLDSCIEICGSQLELARRIVSFHAERGRECRVAQGHVWSWLNKYDGMVPSEHVLPVASASGWKITPHQLRPDLYPHPNDGLPPELRRAA